MSEHQAYELLRIIWLMINRPEGITSTQLQEWARIIAWNK